MLQLIKIYCILQIIQGAVFTNLLSIVKVIQQKFLTSVIDYHWGYTIAEVSCEKQKEHATIKVFHHKQCRANFLRSLNFTDTKGQTTKFSINLFPHFHNPVTLENKIVKILNLWNS